MNAGVDGTEFSVAVEPDKTQVVVYEGQVTASNDQGSIVLADQEAGIAYKDQKPQKEVIVRPLDAVQWALYYPAIIDSRVIEQQLPQTLQATVRESLERYRQGNTFEALAALEALDQNTLSAQLLTYRAGLYLTLGRVTEARHDIAQTLQLQPARGRPAADRRPGRAAGLLRLAGRTGTGDCRGGRKGALRVWPATAV